MAAPEPKKKGRFVRHLRGKLVAGVLTLIPLVATFMILRLVFNFVDGLVEPITRHVFFLDFPGVGVAITVVLVYLVGLVATTIVGKYIIRWIEDVILRVPIIKVVYNFVKQLIDSFQAAGTSKFRVVIVQWPSKGVYTIAFQTGSIKNTAGKTLYNVLIPTGPTPQSGFLAIYPEEDVTPTDLTVEDALKMVVSSGVLTPKGLTFNTDPKKTTPVVPTEAPR